jgi:hypothetical protein
MFVPEEIMVRYPFSVEKGQNFEQDHYPWIRHYFDALLVCKFCWETEAFVITVSSRLMHLVWRTVVPRLTKIIRSGITFVSRNVISHILSGVSLLAVSNVNNPVGLVGLPYVMWSAHFCHTHTDGKDKLLECPDHSCLLLYVSARIH